MADGDYERDFQRKAELERIGRILRASKVSDGWCGSDAPQELRHDTFTGDAMFFVMDPDGLPIEIHE